MSMEKLTVKFAKDVENFFVWSVENNYIIKDIDDEQVDWSIELLKTINFNESSRNKLEGLIKAIMNTYSIYRKNLVIDDAKLMSKDFKEAPIEKSPRKNAKKEKVESSEEETPKIKKEKKEKVESSEEESIDQVKLDMSLDTNDTILLDVLEYWTKDLIKVFGKPKKTGDKSTGHLYEWKIQVNESIYSIYDWNNVEAINDITWYINGSEKNEDDLQILIKYIDEKVVDVH